MSARYSRAFSAISKVGHCCRYFLQSFYHNELARLGRRKSASIYRSPERHEMVSRSLKTIFEKTRRKLFSVASMSVKLLMRSFRADFRRNCPSKAGQGTTQAIHFHPSFSTPLPGTFFHE